METVRQNIPVSQTLDVDAVEHALAELWQKTAGEAQPEHEEATLRTRVANLMVFVTREPALAETHETVRDLSMIHPCRALVMLADLEGESSDIELFVSAFTQSERASQKPQVCGEELTLVARGHFTSELPSAAIPLLVPDLPVFLWWCELECLNDQDFEPLAQSADRLVIDSVNMTDPTSSWRALSKLFDPQNKSAIALSDINWARLTSWRALLANFYDVHEYRDALANLQQVTIDYEAPESNPNGLAAQALLLAGWLASRLQWEVEVNPAESNEELSFDCRRDDCVFRLVLKRVELANTKPGRLAQVEFQSSQGEGATFVVKRTDDGLHLETQAVIGGLVCPGRTLPVRNRTTAQLLAREMEILTNDIPYEEAVRRATRMMNAE